ncbi:eukaryotic translation initiation factor 3 subunit K [Aphelenchoides avenae]|nr:eukaryotic translation initiation factor 3 subunit K [Aphelenchus avenae]
MSNFEQLKRELDESIQGVNRYNPGNVEQLEKCISLMITGNHYDKDILLTTLKLYQLNPQKYNEAVVCQILLKTCMVFPRNDYALAKYLIDTNRLQSQELRRVMDIGALLESCDFGLFWRLMRGDYKPSDAPEERFKNPADVQKTIKPVAGFEDAVRNFACQVITVTFQRIEKAQLARLLGGISDAQVAAYAKAYGWEVRKDGTVFVQNHEDKIKSRNIEERLKFEQCAEILRPVPTLLDGE